MKKILLCTLLLLAALPATSPAEDVDSLIALLRSDLAADKMAIMTAAMELDEAEANVFWPEYRNYQNDLAKLGDAYVEIIKDYAAHWESLTDEKALDLTERAFKYKADRLKLQQSYFKKFCKLVPPVKAARWAQLENKLGLLIETQVAAEIPLAAAPAGH